MNSLPPILTVFIAVLATALESSTARAQQYGNGGWKDYYDERPERRAESQQYLADRVAQIAALQTRQRELQNEQYRPHASYGTYGSYYRSPAPVASPYYRAYAAPGYLGAKPFTGYDVVGPATHRYFDDCGPFGQHCDYHAGACSTIELIDHFCD